MPEPLVFVPGLMADARLFLPQMVALGTRFSVQVCMPTQGDTVEENSLFVLDQAPAKFALIGHGLGGAVALELVIRRKVRRTHPLQQLRWELLQRQILVLVARADHPLTHQPLAEVLAEPLRVPKYTVTAMPRWKPGRTSRSSYQRFSDGKSVSGMPANPWNQIQVKLATSASEKWGKYFRK